MLNLKDDAWLMSPFPKDHLTVIFENAYFVKRCRGCEGKFTSIIRKHHCRGCGKVFCGQCSRKKHYSDDKVPMKQRLCYPCEVQKDKELGIVNSPHPVLDDKENQWDYGNTLSFAMEGDTPVKVVAETKHQTPELILDNAIDVSLVEEAFEPESCGEECIQRLVSTFEPVMVPDAPTSERSPGGSTTKSQKQKVLTVCCALLFLVLAAMVATPSSEVGLDFPSPAPATAPLASLLKASYEFKKSDFQAMIDMQVELTESLMPTSRQETPDIDPDSHSLTINIVKREREGGFRHQMVKFSNFRDSLRFLIRGLLKGASRLAQKVSKYFLFRLRNE